MKENKPIKFNKKQQIAFTTPAHEILYGGSRAGGKGQANDAIVMTPFGPKKFGELKIGSKVSNPDGSVSEVIKVHKEKVFQFYKIKFFDGSETEVTEGHLWLSWRSNKAKKIKGLKLCGEKSAKIIDTLTLKKWCDKAIEQEKTGIKYKNWPLIPLCQEQPFNVTYRYKSVLNPYFLGLMLGDGHFGSVFSLACTTDREFFKSQLDKYDYREENKTIVFRGETHKTIKKNVTTLKLNNTSAKNKFIPRQYKYGTIEERYAVIQGLFDTDGCVEIRDRKTDTAKITYSTISRELAYDIKFIIQSLGGTVSISEKIPTYTYKKQQGNKAYILYVKFAKPEKLFRLPRKKNQAYKAKPQNLFRKVISVEKIDKKLGHCITVDNPNGLYLTNDFIVTHNSFLIRYASVFYSIAVPGLQTYLFRRNVKDLKKNHLSGHESFFAILDPFVKKEKCKINQTDLRIDFDNGSQIHLCHCQHDKDVEKYRGAEIHFLLIDESTQFTPFQIDFLRTNVRIGGFKIDYESAKKVLPFLKDGFFPRIMYATNPGGPSHCIPYGQVLCSTGWIDISKVKVNDIVYSINNRTQTLEKKKVLKIFEYDVKENLVRIKNKKLDIVCTENHSIPYLTDQKKSTKITLKPVIDLPNQANVLRAAKNNSVLDNKLVFVLADKHFLKKQRLNQPLQLSYNDYAELMGWFISVGCFNIKFNFFDIAPSKQKNRVLIEDLLNRCGFKYSAHKDYYRIYSYEWSQYFKEFGLCQDKFIPLELKNSTSISYLFASLMAGDGTWATKNSGSYTTYSEKLRDDILELCVKLGYTCYYEVRQNKNRRLPNQIVYFHKTKTNTTKFYTGNKKYKNRKKNSVHKSSISKIYYEGKVFCIEVEDNHNFVCRQNKKVWISGNSYYKSGWMKPQNPPMTIFQAPSDEGGMDRIYIPAQITDNEDLMKNDPTYREKLLGLGEDNEIRAMLYGDWDALGGDAFGDVWNQKTHVIEPFKIPKNWYVDRTFDWGSSHPFATIWWAESDGSTVKIWDEEQNDYIFKTYPEGSIFAIAEDYGCVEGKSNKGLKLTAREIGQRLREKELEWEDIFDIKDRINPGAADGRIFDTQYGYEKKQSIHDNLLLGYESVVSESYPYGKQIYELFSREVIQYSGSRIKSFELMRTYLKASSIQPAEEPGLYIFKNCRNWINTVPMLSRDPDKVEDVDTKSEDHLYDSTRYRLFTKKKIFSQIKVVGI